MPAPSTPALKVLTAWTGEKDVCKPSVYGLVLPMVDILVLRISRVYHVAYHPDAGWPVCTREKTRTACCTQRTDLATRFVSSPGG